MEAIALRHSKELIGLKPSWCIFSPVSIYNFLDFKINFIMSQEVGVEPWSYKEYILGGEDWDIHMNLKGYNEKNGYGSCIHHHYTIEL